MPPEIQPTQILRLKKKVEKYRQLSALAESSSFLLWSACPNGKIEHCNRGWCDYTQLSKTEFRKRGWPSVFHPDDLPQFLNKWSEAFKIPFPFECEHRLKCGKTREYRWFRSLVTPSLNESGELLRWTGQTVDIHEWKITREAMELVQCELFKTKIAAESANSAKTMFLANISHEIRTPLAAIVGHSGFLLEPRLTSEEQIASIQSIKRNSERLSYLVSEILDLSKMESGNLEVEPLSCNVREILGYVESVVGVSAREKNIQLKFSISPLVPPLITTDPVRLKQILISVVGNAVKFTDRGQVCVEIEAFSKERAGGLIRDFVLRARVSDSGVGMDEKEQSRLFRPFSQSDSSVARRFGGAGLGLALSQRLARVLGGDVKLLQSHPGEGSVFEVTVVVGYKPDKQENASASTKSLRGINILVIDDCAENQVIVQRMLKTTNASVSTADNGIDGIGKALTGNFDLVFMDIQMPGLDGYQATQKLRTLGFKKPIVALTANALKEHRARALASGFDNFLTKPINKDQLINTATHYVSKLNLESSLPPKT